MKVKIFENRCEIIGLGLNGYTYKKNNFKLWKFGTLGRLILGLLIHSKSEIKLIGDSSLSRETLKE